MWLNDAEVLAHVTGWQLTNPESYRPGVPVHSSSRRSQYTARCALVLTRQVLCVVDVDLDIQLRTFTVADIDCHRQIDDESESNESGDAVDTLVVAISGRRHSSTLVVSIASTTVVDIDTVVK